MKLAHFMREFLSRRPAVAASKASRNFQLTLPIASSMLNLGYGYLSMGTVSGN